MVVNEEVVAGEEPKIVDNVVLAMAVTWLSKTTGPNTERLLEQHFPQYEKLSKAMQLLHDGMQLSGKPQGRQGPHKVNKIIEDLVKIVRKLSKDTKPKMKVMLSMDNLVHVPMVESTWGAGDEVSTAARLLNLERQMSEMRMELVKGLQVVQNNPPVAKEQYADIAKSAVAGGSGDTGRKPKNQDKVQGRQMKAAGGGGAVEEQPVQGVDKDGFQEVTRKKKVPRKVQYGTGTATTGGRGGEAAPYEVWIGNTHPDSTKEISEDVLKELGKRMDGKAKLAEELEVLECECLTKERSDGKKPYTRQWSVRCRTDSGSI